MLKLLPGPLKVPWTPLWEPLSKSTVIKVCLAKWSTFQGPQKPKSLCLVFFGHLKNCTLVKEFELLKFSKAGPPVLAKFGLCLVEKPCAHL